MSAQVDELVSMVEAVQAYRTALHAFAHMTGTGAGMFAAEAAVRAAGSNGDGTATVPVECVHFSDVRADGARMVAVNGNLDSETWVAWSGRALRFGCEAVTYAPWSMVTIKV